MKQHFKTEKHRTNANVSLVEEWSALQEVFACKSVQLPAYALSIIKMLKSSLTLAKLTLVQYRCMKLEAFDRRF